MRCYKGSGVSGGIAVGKIRVYRREKQQVKRRHIEDVQAELLRYEAAKEEAARQLELLCQKACRKIGKTQAAIFEAHQMMLADEDYNGSVIHIVQSQMVNAEYAVARTGDNFSRMFALMDDEYMRARAADVTDVTERLLEALSGQKSGQTDAEEAAIIVADDLTPSETVQMEKNQILAFVTEQGSVHSHTAILARTMAIPALTGIPDLLAEEAFDGKTGIVDGTNGMFYVDPDEETLRRMLAAQQEEAGKRELLSALKGKENLTRDGRRILLYANAGGIGDIAAVLSNDAGGIGLFRSEFLYLERDCFPTEEEQFQIYKQVAEMMAGKRVIIRTLDIGADKQCDYFQQEKEENPALGLRAIRLCLMHPEIFRTQLRALFRASAFGKIAVMYPMITGVSEVRRIREIAEQVKTELREQGVLFGEPEQGIMIETPAAALISDLLAPEVDFFSIGTNDLTQYALAADRQHPKLGGYYDPHHPAVLRMISMVVENAHKAGIWAGICGELAADLSLTREFLAMGVDELSVPPGSILPIRRLIREMNVEEYQTRTASQIPGEPAFAPAGSS